MTVNETELVERSQKGDLKAFDRLVILYQRRIFRFVNGKIRNRADTEEIVQNTLMQSFINLYSLRAASSFGSWLFRICRNCISQYCIREKRKLPVKTVDIDELADTGNTDLEWQEYASTVLPALDKLSVEQEEVIRLRYFAGLSYKEIGLLCTIGIDRVKSRLHEARQILKTTIPDLYREINVPRYIVNRNKEKIMHTLELIKKGAYVVRALSLETQLHLCRLAKEGTKFDEQLIEAIGKIKHGKEFVKGYQSCLMMEDLVWIFTFSRELQEWIIENLEEIDPGLAEDFKHRTFILEDMVLLDPDAVQKILEKIPAETIVIAMLSCETEIKRYIMSFFPVAKQQELLLKIPVLKTDHKAIEVAHFEVLQVISQMAEEKVIRVGHVPDPNETMRMHLKMQNIE